MRAALLPLVAALAAASGCAPEKPAAVAVQKFAKLGPVSNDVLDAILPDAEAAVAIEVGPIRDLPITRSVLILTKTKIPVDMFPQLLGAANVVGRQFEPCGFSPGESLQMLAASEKNGRGVLAAKFDVPPEKVLKCVLHFLPTSEPARFGDVEAMRLVTGHYMVARGDLVWLGDKDTLEEALKPHPKGQLVDKVKPTKDTVAGIYAQPKKMDGNPSVHAFATIASDGFAIEAHLTLPTEALAKQLAADLADMKGRVTAQTKGLIESLEIVITPTGTKLDVKIAAHGGSDVQTAGLAALAAVVAIEVRRIQDVGKVAQAKATLGTIAKSLEAAYKKPRADGKHAFPGSGRAIPQIVPKGTRAYLTEADWDVAGWKDVGFKMTEPSYFQYEFQTAPDGKKVTLRARADLDGNGKSSLLEVKLSGDADGGVTTAPLTAKDELE